MHHSLRKPLLRLVLAGLLLTACISCGSSGTTTTESGMDKVNAGVISIVDTAPIHLGKAKGFFAKQKIDLTITPVQGGAASVSGLVSGQFQFAFANVTSLFTAKEQGLDIKVVANGVSSTGVPGKDFSAVLVKADSPIKTAADLAGKTVSVNQLRNIGDTTIRAAVRKAGGDPSQIKFVELPFPDAPAALQNGRVDAIWVVEPFVTQAISQGARPIAWNYAEAAPNLTVALYFTSSKTDPDLVRRFTAAMNESLTYAQQHPDEAREILKTYTKIDPELIAKITLPNWPTEVNRESLQQLADAALADGVLKTKIDVSELLP
ncbi:MAG: ABC transporter substrate-binding protein [Thermobispora bispora]|nr:ABC transporter substrate-binding protein [Thermobispora bispora]